MEIACNSCPEIWLTDTGQITQSWNCALQYLWHKQVLAECWPFAKISSHCFEDTFFLIKTSSFFYFLNQCVCVLCHCSRVKRAIKLIWWNWLWISSCMCPLTVTVQELEPVMNPVIGLLSARLLNTHTHTQSKHWAENPGINKADLPVQAHTHATSNWILRSGPRVKQKDDLCSQLMILKERSPVISPCLIVVLLWILFVYLFIFNSPCNYWLCLEGQ